MKKVFNSNYDLIHTFAQQTQIEGQTSSGNVFFYDKKIYSYGYHYKLAEFLTPEIILINNIGYSSSTAKHINIISGATIQYKQYFTMDVDLDCVYNIIIDNNNKLKNARKPEIYVNIILNKFESLTKFLKEFKQINLLKSDKYKELKKIYNLLNKDRDAYIEKAKEREKREKQKKLLKFQDDLIKFFNYDLNYIVKSNNQDDYIRISEDKKNIETTQGVKISIEECRKLYTMIENNINIERHRIDNYIVTSMDGALKIGCHNINIKNVHEIGQKIKSL